MTKLARSDQHWPSFDSQKAISIPGAFCGVVGTATSTMVPAIAMAVVSYQRLSQPTHEKDQDEARLLRASRQPRRADKDPYRPHALSEIEKLSLAHIKAEVVDDNVAESGKTICNDKARDLEGEVDPYDGIAEGYHQLSFRWWLTLKHLRLVELFVLHTELVDT